MQIDNFYLVVLLIVCFKLEYMCIITIICGHSDNNFITQKRWIKSVEFKTKL